MAIHIVLGSLFAFFLFRVRRLPGLKTPPNYRRHFFLVAPQQIH
jgi:hypothetical protein